MAEEWNRLGECEVCNSQSALYTCPRCEVKTCSLACVNIHKKELNCDGIRSKTAFKRLSKFTNLDLQSDYQLLEQVSRSVDSYGRDKIKYCTRFRKDLPVHLHKLGSAASERDTRLHFLPQNFSRHKTNTTFYDWKTHIIHWRVEWIFQQADNIKCVDDRLAENASLASLVNKYLDPQTCEPLLQDRLQYYQSAGLSGICFFLKAERVKNCDLRYYELDSALTLKENLKGKTIIEFPTVYVVLKGHKDMYETVNSDEEEQEQTETEDILGQKRYKQTARKGSKKPVNFLFGDADFDDSGSEQEEKLPKKQKLDIPCYDELIHQ